jgi:hypothetical protein
VRRGRSGRASTRSRGALGVAIVGALSLAPGCASRAFAPPAACAPALDRSPVDAICAADAEIHTVRARFRATVTTASGQRGADGVLAVRRPGALRVKLFTLAGITVYDALWIERDGVPTGHVSLPLAGREIEVSPRSGESLADPEVGLSLALWALWQPRCVVPPASVAAEPGRFVLDPASAYARSREVTVVRGEVRAEALEPIGGLGSGAGRVIVRYGALDCTLPVPLPRRLEIEAPDQGWSAEVRVLEIEENPALDERLFATPSRQVGQGERR